jgi:integrase
MATDILNEAIPDPTPENKPEAKKRQKKVPGIYKRGNRWQIDTTYKWIRLRETCATFEMAESALRKQKTLVDEGRYLEKKHKSTETLGEFKIRYLQWCEDIRQKTAYDKGVYFRPMIAHFGESVLLSGITRAQIEQYQAKRLSSPGQRRKEIKPATVNREIATLKHLFSKAVEWKEIDDSPARGIKMLKENNRRLRYLTPEECRALIEKCEDQTLQQVVVLAINTGMRKGEILNLRWLNVNLRERFIELPDQKSGERGTVPLNETAVETLRAIPRRIDSEFVFTGKIPGQPFCDLKKPFEAAVKAAKLDGVTFHTLRHTAASHLVMAGVDIATVREILRHKSIEMTLRYSHLSPDHKKSAVEALGNALAAEAKNEAKTA